MAKRYLIEKKKTGKERKSVEIVGAVLLIYGESIIEEKHLDKIKKHLKVK